jgi:transcriptional regulator with XRE-family HTH domain
MTGRDLKLKRVGADVRVKELAVAMGVSDSRISRLENSRIVTDDARSRYLAALATLTTIVTSSDATSAA